MQDRNEFIGGKTIFADGYRRKKGMRRLSLAAAATLSSLLGTMGARANTANSVLNGSADLTNSGRFSGGAPSTSNDIQFTNITYSPTAFTLNTNSFNLNIGTLDDLDATQTLTIQNTTGGSSSTITLNGGNNSVSGIAGDLLYVAPGGNLAIGNASTGTLNLALAAGGNFDIAGNATIGSVISDSGGGFTKTGTGTLILSNANAYTGSTTINAGVLTLTGSLNSTSLNLGGGTFNYSKSGSNSQSFTTTSILAGGQSAINNTVSTDTLNLGNLTQTAGSGGTVKFTATGNITTSTLDTNGGMIGGWAVIDNGNNTYSWAHSGNSTGTYTITAAAVTTTASTTANWVGDGQTSTGGTINTLIENGGGDITINGALTLASGGIIDQNVNKWIKGTGNITSGLASGELFLYNPNASLTDSEIQVQIVNGSNPTILVKNGPGLAILTAANTYSGGTILNGGTLQLNNNSALGTGNVTLSGGSLQMNAKTLANNLIAAAGTTSTIDNSSGDSYINGNLSGSGSVTIQNSSGNNLSVHFATGVNWSGFTGTLTYSASAGSQRNVNIFAPSTTLDLGNATVVFSNSNNNSGSSFRTGSGETVNFGSLSGFGYIQDSGNVAIGNLNTGTTFSGIIQNGGSSGAVIKLGGGTLNLSGGSSYTGKTTVENGTLIAGANAPSGANGAFGSATTAIALGDATTISANQSVSLLTGGAFTVGRGITVGSANTTTTGTYTIGGGTATSSTFSGTETLNQNLSVTQVAGGTLNLTGNITSGSSGTQTLFFNNVGSISQSTGIIGGGTGNIAVVQAGGGTTTLSGNNTYKSATTVSAGALFFSGNSAIGTVTVGNATTLGVTASSASQTILSPTALTFGAGNLTLNLNGLSSLSVPLIADSGALMLNGNVAVSLLNAGSLPTGNYTLISYGSEALNGNSFSPTTFTFGHTVENLVDNNASAINLLVSAVVNTWSGATNGTWDVNTSQNWSASGQVYLQGDNVLFNDTGNNTTINIATNVSPASVTFNNSAKTYTMNSSGGFGISGATGITLSGNGTVIFNNSNSYTGATAINAGALEIAGNSALGTGSGNTTSGVTVASGGALQLTGNISTTTAVGLTLNGTGLSAGPKGALENVSGSNTYSGLIALGSNATIGSDAGTLTLSNTGNMTGSGFNLTLTGAGSGTLASVIGTGNGTVTKSGNGTWQLNGASAYSGGTTLSAGTLVFGNAAALGTGTVMLAGGTLKAGGGFTLSNNFSLTGSTSLDMSGNNVGFSGNLSNSAALNLTNSGFPSTLNLSGNNSGYNGTITIGNGNAISFNSASAGSAGAAWVFNDPTGDRVRINIGNATLSFGAFSGSGQLQNDTAGTTSTISVGALNTNATFSGTLQNGVGVLTLTKVGNGALVVTGNSLYSGGTTVSAGTLFADNATGSLGSGVVNVNGGLLAGNGTIANGSNALTVNAGGSIGAGGNATAIGTLTTGSQTWNGNGTYAWKLSSTLGTAGVSPKTGASGNISGAGGSGVEGTDWDLLNLTSGTLNLSSLTSTSPFTIAPSGNITGNAKTYSWVIAQTSGNSTITLPSGYTTGQDLTNGNSSGDFVLNTSGLTDNTSGGPPAASQFSLEAVVLGGHEDLVLDYAGTPEPGTTILVIGGAVPMLMGRRRRAAKSKG